MLIFVHKNIVVENFSVSTMVALSKKQIKLWHFTTAQFDIEL
jgi:hypothetical protein